MTYIQEEWKPVVGFESYYEVSNCGRVRLRYSRSRYPAGFIMRDEETVHGYLTVKLNSTVRKHRPIHQLVAAAFIGARPFGYQVNHQDGNKHNNYITNLEYVTPSENQRHAVAIGLRPPGRGRPKLTDHDVTEIRSLKGVVNQHIVATVYRVHRDTVSRIHRGFTWGETKL